MHPRFIVRTPNSPELLKGLSKVYTRLRLKFVYYVSIAVGVLSVLVSLPLIAMGEYDLLIDAAPMVLIFILMMLAMPHILYQNILRSNKRYEKMITNYVFHENTYSLANDVETLTARYDTAYEVIETADTFYLFANRTSAVILPKDSFTMGSSQDFGPFIEAKVGKKIRYLQ